MSKFAFNKRSNIKGVAASNSARLTECYPAAYEDFYGMPSGAPCIYKSGPAWPDRTGPEAYRCIREARPVYGHPIASSWLKVGTGIYNLLDSYGVMWTSIDPITFANVGEKKPLCPLLIWIGVKEKTLLFNTAVAAANAIKNLLSLAGFPDTEVAFRESEVTRSVAGPRLATLDVGDRIVEFRKPFTPTLGISIAPLKTPHYEGTGSLYFRLSKGDERIVLLTAAHVACPPPTHDNVRKSHKHVSQPREDIIALGNMSYKNAVSSMVATIDTLSRSIQVWNEMILQPDRSIKDKDAVDTAEHKKIQTIRHEVKTAAEKINTLKNFHGEVTKHRAEPNQRTIGFVLHAEPIVIANGPEKFTSDWALIQLYQEKINWTTFLGNKIYIGDRFSPFDFGELMFPQLKDRTDYTHLNNGLLQAFGVVKGDEIRRPQHLNIRDEKTLFVVKNGMATGTTIGHTNGLESFTRTYSDYGIKDTSIELAILAYDKNHSPFSSPGDSGAIILDRTGRIVALLTGGSGVTDKTDITYGTPYWWLEEQIKKVFPNCCLY